MQFLRSLVNQTADGALGLEDSLAVAGFNITFNELYLNWMTALTINENGFANDRFCYRGLDVTIQDYTAIGAVPFEDDISLYCYGSKVYKLAFPPDDFVVKMTQPGDEIAGISVAYEDSTGWHVEQKQNRGTATLSISGVSVNTAYLIISHLFYDVPSGTVDFGSGALESVRISVYESEETTSSKQTTATVTSGLEPSTSESASTTITTTSIPTSGSIVPDYMLAVFGGLALVATIVVLFVIQRRQELKQSG